MSANQARFRIATMARVPGVSPSGYHAWRRRRRSARAQADADLTIRVRAIHARGRGTYGAPRIHAELSEAGAVVSRRRVARVMRPAGICFDNAMAGSFLRDAGVRVDRPHEVGDARRGAVGRVRVHRRVVQHAAASFRVRLPVAAGFRTSPGDGARGRGTRGPVGVRRAGAGRRRHRRCCRKHGEGMTARGRTARLRLRAADTRREAASADRPGAGGAVDLPGLWTPGRRRAASADRRGGRPQAVGNLAGDRCRRRLRRGREIPTGPQRFSSLMTHTKSVHPGPVMMGTRKR